MIVLWLLFLPSAAKAQLHVPEIAQRETGTQEIRHINSNELLYNFHWVMTRMDQDGRSQVKFVGKGDNNLEADRRIEWSEESLAELGGRGLQTVRWEKHSSGAEQESWLLEYDWQAGNALYLHVDHVSGKREEKTITLGKHAMSADSMLVSLRGFPFEKGAGYRLAGEFVLTDGSILKGSVVHRGVERIETAFGEQETYKLELDPSGLTGFFAPAMYIWYTKTRPHLFLRFDGKDAGLLKPRTKNILLNFEPASWLIPTHR